MYTVSFIAKGRSNTRIIKLNKKVKNENKIVKYSLKTKKKIYTMVV